MENIQKFSENVPVNLKCKYPKMPEIEIDLNGVIKLLANLKPDEEMSNSPTVGY